MKIAVCSDIHNEFDIWKPKNPDKADVLILAGDIIVNQMLSDKSCINFFNQCAKKFKHVIYVMGNHEYYGADFLTALDLIKNKLSHLSNLYILNNPIIFNIVGGVDYLLRKTNIAPSNEFDTFRLPPY